MEAVMMDSMYTIPSDTKAVKCIITKNAVLGEEKPQIIFQMKMLLKANCKTFIKKQR